MSICFAEGGGKKRNWGGKCESSYGDLGNCAESRRLVEEKQWEGAPDDQGDTGSLRLGD